MGKFLDNLHTLRAKIFGEKPPLVAVVRLTGVIGEGGRFSKGLTLESIAETLDEAFALRGLSAIAFQINSPGGSPVQSAFITDRIRDLAREKDIPVLTFAEDVAASGGYMLMLAGDKLYAHEASIVGSIGVISGGFGYVEAMKKLGVERRVYSAGERKSQLDPFMPEDESDVEHLKGIQIEVHEFFKKMVRDRRGKRLKGLRGKIFSGEFFTGAESKRLGLIDETGEMRKVLKDRFGDKVRIKKVGEKKKGLMSLLGMSKSGAIGEDMAGDIAGGILSSLEEKAQWGRFGR